MILTHRHFSCEGEDFYLFAPATAPPGTKKEEREGREERKEEREKLGTRYHEQILEIHLSNSMAMHVLSLFCLCFHLERGLLAGSLLLIC